MKDPLDIVYKSAKTYTRLGMEGPNGESSYGENTQGTLQKAFEFWHLKDPTFGSEGDIFLDVGHGLGKPNVHYSQLGSKKKISIGIECSEHRYNLSIRWHKDMIGSLKNEELNGGFCFVHLDGLELQTLNPFKHIFMFDCGYSKQFCLRLATLLKACKTLETFASWRTVFFWREKGLDLKSVGQFTTSLLGSKENKTGYIYRIEKQNNNNKKMAIEDNDVNLQCDPKLEDAIRVCRSTIDDQISFVKNAYSNIEVRQQTYKSRSTVVNINYYIIIVIIRTWRILQTPTRN